MLNLNEIHINIFYSILFLFSFFFFFFNTGLYHQIPHPAKILQPTTWKTVL